MMRFRNRPEVTQEQLKTRNEEASEMIQEVHQPAGGAINCLLAHNYQQSFFPSHFNSPLKLDLFLPLMFSDFHTRLLSALFPINTFIHFL